MDQAARTSLVMVVLLSACTARHAPAAKADGGPPHGKQLVVLAASPDEASLAELESRSGRGQGVHWLFEDWRPKIIKSDQLDGPKPGSYLWAGAACSSPQESKRILELVQTDFGGAFQTEVADSPLLPPCPSVKSGFSMAPDRSPIATGEVIHHSTSLRWNVLAVNGFNPVFRKVPYDSTWLNVTSGDTTVCSRQLKATSDAQTTTSYQHLGMIEGIGRDWPVISERRSWHGGDMCNRDIYVFRAGNVVRAASIEDNFCSKRPPQWRVEGSLDEPAIRDARGIIHISKWDSLEGRYRRERELL